MVEVDGDAPHRRRTHVEGSLALRCAAAEGLGRLGDADAVTPLTNVLSAREPLVRAYAAEALGGLGANGVLERLSGLLNDASPGVRGAAVRALGRLGDARAATRLADRHHGVRECAVEALGNLGRAEAVDVLVELLSEPDAVIGAMRKRSPLASAAAQSLTRIITRQDDDASFRALLERWPLPGSMEANVALYDVLAEAAPGLYARLDPGAWNDDIGARLAAPTSFALAAGLWSSQDRAHQARADELIREVLDSPVGDRFDRADLERWRHGNRVEDLLAQAFKRPQRPT